MARIIEGTIGRLGLPGKEIRERSAGREQRVPIACTVALKPAAFRSSRRIIKAHPSRCCRPHFGSQPLSCWRQRCPQSGDQPQDVVEHLSRHRDLGHLEHDVAGVADDLGADLDRLLPQTRQGPRLRCRGHRQGSHEVAEVVGVGSGYV